MARLTSRNTRAESPSAKLEQTGKTRKRGTKITFKPDTEIFTETGIQLR